MADSGATKSMLKPISVERMNLEISDATQEVDITFGGGSRESSHLYTKLGPQDAVVVEHLIENLISMNQFVDDGSYVHLDKTGDISVIRLMKTRYLFGDLMDNSCYG